MTTATITVNLGDGFVDRLAEAIVRHQLGGETVKAPESSWPGDDQDPWGVPENPPASTTAPSRGTSAPTTEVVNTPKGPQTWTLNLPNAPMCLCGVPAAHIQGSTNGRPWARYGCVKAKDKSTYRSKCDFSQWA